MMSIKKDQKHQVEYEQALNKNIEQKKRELLQLHNSNYKIRPFFREIIASQEFYEWAILRQLIQNEQIVKKTQFYSQIVRCLDDLCANQQQTYVMKLFLYGWLKQKNIRSSVHSWSSHFRNLLHQGKLLMLHSWLTQTPDWNNPSTIQTLNMLCKYFPILIKSQRISIEQQYLEFIIHIVCYIDLKRQEHFQAFDQFIGLIKHFRAGPAKDRNYEIQQQEHIILKTLLDVLSNAKNCRGNVGWLFLPRFTQQKDIKTFFYYYAEQILNFSQNQLVNIFTKLFQNSLDENALIFFYEASLVLKNVQKYYELKILYQKVTLPILIRRGKARIHEIQLVYEISSFYAIGFYQHCDIGINGLICLLSNISKVQDQQIRLKWIQLSLMIGEKNIQKYTPFIYEQLVKQGFTKNQIQKIDNAKGFQNFESKIIWQISSRDGRKSKTYNKQKSKDFKGIQNHSQQCYIISVIQALSTTKQLPRVLKEYKTHRRNQVCYHLIELFDNLKSKYNIGVSVDKVKQQGPQYFSESLSQEDSQQYLVKLFEKIQDELSMAKERLLIEQFNKCFKSTIFRRLECQNCQNVLETQQKQYLHTIPNRTSLREEQIEVLSDYMCEKCKKKDFLNKIQLRPTSLVFIVHINRFSFKNQKSCKQLATQNIKRQFMGYELKGIIFHIGKNVQSGHYVYYYHVQNKKWVQMNDNNVYEFKLDKQNQEFQLEMKAQMTPYILFYVKKEK